MKKQPKRKSRPGIDEYGRNKFINLVISNDINRLREIINTAIDVNLQDDDGWTALHFAAQNFNEEIIKLLLDNGANPNLKDTYGNTPIIRALFNSRGKDTNIFDLFLENGGDPNMKNNSGVSALELAEQVDNFDLKKYFISYLKEKE